MSVLKRLIKQTEIVKQAMPKMPNNLAFCLCPRDFYWVCREKIENGDDLKMKDVYRDGTLIVNGFFIVVDPRAPRL